MTKQPSIAPASNANPKAAELMDIVLSAAGSILAAERSLDSVQFEPATNSHDKGHVADATAALDSALIDVRAVGVGIDKQEG